MYHIRPATSVLVALLESLIFTTLLVIVTETHWLFH